jgi:zinc protease
MDLQLRKSPPAALEPAGFDIGRPFQTTLDNGLRVVIFQNQRLPLINLRLAFFSGDIDDPAGHTGITSAMASMLTEGTQNYTSQQLAGKVERLGASLGASASDDFTLISASSLSLYTDEMLGLIAEVLLWPTFPEGELDLYRRNTVEHLKFQRSQPPFLAGERAARLIYGKHPYSIVSPSPADIEKLEREGIVAFHRKRLVPNNAMLIVVGDVENDEFVAAVGEHLGDWQAGDVKHSVHEKPESRDTRSLTIVDRPGSAQSNIVMGNLAMERTSDDYFPFLVMNQVLGAGASSRVFMNLREEKGYTYGAYTRINAKRLAGDIEATAEVRNDVTGDSIKEFFYELERIRDEKVGDQELADAKSFLTGVFPIRAETQEGLTNLLVNQHIYGLSEDYLQTYRERVAAVTADDVLEAAKKYVRPDEMAIVVVGDAEAVLPQTRDFAESVEIFDTEGKRRER